MSSPFTHRMFAFLRELEQNNEREWFEANRERYEEDLVDPALTFVSDFGPRLDRISPHFLAVPKRVGGSLFRIYRDVRFSRDKTPYKTHVGIHFRHETHRDAHAPGFYLHLAPRGSFTGVGIWRPSGEALAAIRTAVADEGRAWGRATGKRFQEHLRLAGDSLKRPPRGFDADHPRIADLRRKDFIGVADLNQKEILAADFPDRFEELCRAGAPLVRFLCRALDVPF